MKIFVRELRRGVKSFAIWTAVNLFLCIYTISVYTPFKGDVAELLDVKLPAVVQTAMGMSGLDFGNPIGFFGMIYSYVLLCAGLFSAMKFADLMAREISDGTSEYILALPVSRGSVLLQKLAAGFVLVTVHVAICFAAAGLLLPLVTDDPWSRRMLVLLAIGAWIASLLFGAITFFLSSLLPKAKAMVSVSVAVVAGLYILQIVFAMTDRVPVLAYLTPFGCFEASQILADGGFNLWCLFGAILALLAFFAAGFAVYQKRDIPSV